MDRNPAVSHPYIRSSGVGGTQDYTYSHHQDQRHDGIPESPLSAIPWYSDDEELSPRASKYYSELFALYTHKRAVDDTAMGDCDAASNPAKPRPNSSVTVFPGFVEHKSTLKSPRAIQQQLGSNDNVSVHNHSFFKRYFKKAKEIYRNGPPGEAQVFWEGIKSYFKEKERGVVFEICSPVSRAVAVPHSRRHSLVAHKTIESTKHSPWHGTVVSNDTISRTSREVPVKLRQTVLNVDTNKRLPPSPPLSPAPKKRPRKNRGKVFDVNKPLPRTPLPCSDTQKPSDGDIDESSAEIKWPCTHIDTAGAEAAASRSMARQSILQDTQQPMQQADKAVDPPNSHTQGNGKSRPSRKVNAHNAIKAQISYPIPIPPAANPSSTFLQPKLPHAISEKAQGKQKLPPSPAWLTKLAHPTLPAIHRAEKRPDSDESFGCQGLGDEIELDVYVGDGGRSVQEDGPRMRIGENGEEVLRPKSLFTGRDSFYDVDDEWADQRRTGRWI